MIKNTTAAYIDIQIINSNTYETNRQGTPLFLDKHPRENLMRENWCNNFGGFLLLSSSSKYNSGCPLNYLVIEIKYTAKNLSEISSLHPVKSLWFDNWTGYPWLQLRRPFALASWAYMEYFEILHQICTTFSTS